MSILEFIARLTPLELFFISATLGVTALGWYGTTRVRDGYRGILQDLDRVRAEGPGAAQNPVVQAALQGYERALQRAGAPLNPTVLVDRALSKARGGGRFLSGVTVQGWVRTVRMAISVCVVVGLLGTFSGLTLALFGVTDAIEQAASQTGTNADMLALLLQLRSLIGGMSTAFQASVAGVFGSLVLTVLSSVRGTFSQSDQVADELENYLTNEFVPAVSAKALGAEFQAAVLERLAAMESALREGPSGGAAEATRELTAASKAIAKVLQEFEPVTGALTASGQSLSSLAHHLEQLHKVEAELVGALGSLPAQNARLSDGIDLFQSGARQLEASLASFSERWPKLVEEFAARTEQAVEHQALNVSESLERLRTVLEQGQKETLDRMDDLVSINQTTADAVNKAVVGRAPVR